MAVDVEHEAVIRLLLQQVTEMYDLEEASSKRYGMAERLSKSGTIQDDQDQLDLAAKVMHDPLEVCMNGDSSARKCFCLGVEAGF